MSTPLDEVDSGLYIAKTEPKSSVRALFRRRAAKDHSDLSVSLRGCAEVLHRQKHAVVDALIAGTTNWRENRFKDPPAQQRDRVSESVTLLVRCLRGEKAYGALYAGQRIFELTQLERPREENYSDYRRTVAEELAVYSDFLKSHVDTRAVASFRSAFQSLTRGLTGTPQRHVNALFIGDCLLHEILAFLVGPLMDIGISVDPFSINPRDPEDLERILASLSTKAFDAVFISPFSHTRLPEIARLLNPRWAFASRREADALVTAVIRQTRELLAALSRRFECPIFIHDAGLVVRSSDAARLSGRMLLTHRARAMAGPMLNRWLTEWVETVNSSTYRHLFVVPETELVRRLGHLKLGRFLATSEFQHSSVLGQHLALEYHTRMSAVGRLLGRKLVICDLDHTLWEGIIGEGPVTHHEPRQRSLKRLKDSCGVVLSIASKNDPANVHFRGGVLTEADFVAPQISWGQKSGAIANIRQTLNLQTKHMVFLDDRPDERAMVQEAFPDILTLDPADPETWRLIDIWADMTLGSSDLDRTQLYREQELRDAQIASETHHSGATTDSETLRKLGLVMTISTATRGDLKRIAELINRTNQWNLCGTRTNFEQVRAWHAADDVQIFLGKVADRFGDMGVVCVAIVNTTAEQAEISAFVLSCRAFGYGIESAMLAEISRCCGIGTQRPVLKGFYRANAQNHPCRNMYQEHGFTPSDGGFEWRGSPPLPAVPWLEVRCLSA